MKKEIASIAKKYHLEMIILFGSMATGRARQDSDADIAIIKKKKLTLRQEVMLNIELSRILGREVDMIDVEDAGALLLGQIARDGQMLYGSKNAFTSTKVYFTKQYIDFMPYFKLREKTIRRKIHELTANAR